MTARNVIVLPLCIATGLGLLAAILGLISVDSLHTSVQSIAQDHLQRVRSAGRLEAGLQRLAQREQALFAARSAAEVDAARSQLASARSELMAIMDELASTGAPSSSGHRAEVEAYLEALDRVVPLVERRSEARAMALARGEGREAFQRYLAAVDAVRTWSKATQNALAPEAVPLPSPPMTPDLLEPSGWMLRSPIDPLEISGAITDAVGHAWALQSEIEAFAASAPTDSEAAIARNQQALTEANQRLMAAVKPGNQQLADALGEAVNAWVKVTGVSTSLAQERSRSKALSLAREASPHLSAAQTASEKTALTATEGALDVGQAATETYSTTLKTALPALALAVVFGLLGVWRWQTKPEAKASSAPEPSPEPATQAARSDEATDGRSSEGSEVVTIHELTSRIDLLAVEAETAAARVTELGDCFTSVAVEVRRLAEQSQSAVDELIELPKTTAELSEDQRAALDRIMSDMEVMATLVIEMGAAVRSPDDRESAAGDANASATLASPPWPATNCALDDRAARLIDAVSRLRSSSGDDDVQPRVETPA